MTAQDFKPTTQSLELSTGETVRLSINFFLLSRLKLERPEIYRRFFAVYSPKKGEEADPIFGMIDVLYTGYVCGCMVTDGAPMEYDAFLMALPEDVNVIMQAGSALVHPKKSAASGTHSSGAPTSAKTE